MKEEKFPNRRKTSLAGLWGVLESQMATQPGEKKKKKKRKKTTNYTPNHNSQQRNSPDARVHQQRAGAEQEGAG